MSISDIMTIRNLLPGSEPDFHLKPRQEPKSYKFRNGADRAAASEELTLIMKRLYEDHGHNCAAITEELAELVINDARLMTALIDDTFDEFEATCRERTRGQKQRGTKR